MEPADCANRWHQWSVKGAAEVLDMVVERLDATLPSGWQRIQWDGQQVFRSRVRPGTALYSLSESPTHPSVTLGIARSIRSELRAGPTWIARPASQTPPPLISGAWEQIIRFLDDGIVPAARSTGAAVSAPTFEELFLAELPAEVADRLVRFSQAARKVLPLDREETELWRSFVIGAFRAKCVVNSRGLVEWLVSRGWGRESAMQLDISFFDYCALLDTYADEVSAA